MSRISKILSGLVAFVFLLFADIHARGQTIPVDFNNDISAVGGATFQIASGVLTASNINNLNLDGIKPDVLGVTGGIGATKWNTNFDASVFGLLAGSSINPVVFGVSDGAPTSSPSGLRRVGSQFQMSAEFDPGAPIAVDILDHNGQAIFSAQGVSPGNIPILIQPNGQRIQLEFDFGFLTASPSGQNICSWEFSFSDADSDGASFFDLNTGSLLAIGRTMVAREIVPEEPTTVTDALITGQNLQPVNARSMTFDIVPEPSAVAIGIAGLLMGLLSAREMSRSTKRSDRAFK